GRRDARRTHPAPVAAGGGAAVPCVARYALPVAGSARHEHRAGHARRTRQRSALRLPDAWPGAVRRADQQALRNRVQALGAQCEAQRAARHDAILAAVLCRSARSVLTTFSVLHAGFDMTTVTDRLARCYTGAVHDVLRMMDYERIALPPDIKAIAPGTKLAGPVWTVSGHIDRTKTRHETLLGWCTLLAKAPAGHIIVCQPNNHDVALMGELSAQTLAARGVLGFVVDGGSRDTDLVLAQGFPVFCAFLTPSGVVARWVPDRYGGAMTLGEPITIGEVTIGTGDYLLGDRDGVVIIPQAIVEDVVSRTEEVVATESEMRAGLGAGTDPVGGYKRS